MVGQSHRKIDAYSNLLGGESYTQDIIEYDKALVIKLLRSPHAFARIRNIDINRAEKLEGIVKIFTHHDVPDTRYTECGESEPEASPYDRLIIDKYVRYVGDTVAIIVGENEKICEKAKRLIKVDYEIYEPILTREDALNVKDVIHKEDDAFEPFPFGYDPKKNIVSRYKFGHGDIEKEFNNSDLVIEREYSTHAQAHVMLETLRAYARIDERGRLEIISSNQSIHHMRRQVVRALNLRSNQVRVRRIRIGGGFGGKNIALTEPIVGFVTWYLKRPSYIIYNRTENFTSTSTRHAMEFKVKIGAMSDGTIRAIQLKSYNDTGAYGSNGPAVTMEAGNNTLPIYAKVPAINYEGVTYYTNHVSAGAMRGYGTPQGNFALDSCINELSHKLGLDPVAVKLKNTIRSGYSGGFVKNPIHSINVEECLQKGQEEIGVVEKQESNDHKRRGIGNCIAIHSSGVSFIDVSTVRIEMQEDGSYLLFTGSADLGTGSDTVLLQIASKALKTDMNNIHIVSGDTDSCPYDTGAYASCTTFMTGNAVLRAAEKIMKLVLRQAGKLLKVDVENLRLDGKFVIHDDGVQKIGLDQIAKGARVGPEACSITATASYGVRNTPRPFLAGFAEVDVNLNTGEVSLLRYIANIDCGTVINPTLAKVQAEGGILQGIGFTLFEDVHYSSKGRMKTDSMLHYKIPSREDIGDIIINFYPEYELEGPYGAKSLGEVVMNAPASAITDAVYNACGVRIRELPITAEKILKGLKEKNDYKI